MKRRSRLLLCAMLFVNVSCGTICTISEPECSAFGPYSGVRASAQGHSTQLDVPFSFVLDTLLLPASIPTYVWQRRLESSAGIRTVLVHTLYKSGGEAPVAQSLVFFDDGFVRLQTTGGTPIWRRMTRSDQKMFDSIVQSPQFHAAVAALPRNFACCDAAEVSLSLGRTHANVDTVTNPSSVTIPAVDSAPPSIRQFLKFRDKVGASLFGRKYLRLERHAA